MNLSILATARMVGTKIKSTENIQNLSVIWNVQRGQELDILHIRKSDMEMKEMDPSWIALVIFPPMDVRMTFTMTILMLIASSKSNFKLLLWNKIESSLCNIFFASLNCRRNITQKLKLIIKILFK